MSNVSGALRKTDDFLKTLMYIGTKIILGED
jgi:hypothetical protein